MINEMKSYLRIDENDEDNDILDLISSSEEYLFNTGVTVSYESKLYTLVVKRLTLYWYEHRDEIGSDENISHGLNSMITQLKYC